MRALVVHIGEGGTQILLASTHREDLAPALAHRAARLFEGAAPPAARGHDRLHTMHDQTIRNGADLSLRYLGQLDRELRENLLRQAAEAIEQFRGIADERTVTISASLLDPAFRAGADPLVEDFQLQMETPLRTLTPQDEALWMLRGVRGLYPGGRLASFEVGYWSSMLAFEEPGRAPRLQRWDVGTTRMPAAGELRQAFPSPPDMPRDTPLLLTGELGWRLGALQVGLCCHDLDLLDEAWLEDIDFMRMDTQLKGLTVEERNLIPMIDQRGDSLPDALLLVRTLLATLGQSRVRICSRGVAHGLASHIFFEGRRRVR